MAVWMELRCDLRGNGNDGVDCWSHQNNGPMDMGDNSGVAVTNLRRELFKEAKTGGWRMTRKGLLCPSHVAALEAKDRP